MLKFFQAAILCVFFLNCLCANGQENNSTAPRVKSAFYNYYYYPYSYYNWYNYVYPSYTFSVASCNSFYSCPTQCPGTCGLWGGLSACRCDSCPLVGSACSYANIQSGLYLHAFPYDSSRYVQCDSTPGVIYIRSCPSGLVFDSRFSVCNYPSQVYYSYWGKK